jgi:hypothetical protein
MGQLGVCPGRSRLDTIEQVHDQLCNRVLVGATIPTEAKRLRGWINEHDAWTQNVHPHALARDVIVAREHVGRAEFHLTEAEHKLDIFDGNLTPSQQDSQLAEAYRHYLRATWHTDLADCQIQNYCENNISMPT